MAFLEVAQSLQTDTRLLKKEVGNLKKNKTTLINKIQSTEVLLEMVQSGTKLLEKEISNLKEDTNNLTNKSQST